MATETSLKTIWRTPEDLWSLIAPLLGPEKQPGTPGRPAVPFRRIFEGILYVLRTGCQWRALPREEYAPKSTVWGRFKPWVEAGVFQQAWLLVLAYYDQELGIDWQWQALDGVITKAPLGGEARQTRFKPCIKKELGQPGFHRVPWDGRSADDCEDVYPRGSTRDHSRSPPPRGESQTSPGRHHRAGLLWGARGL